MSDFPSRIRDLQATVLMAVRSIPVALLAILVMLALPSPASAAQGSTSEPVTIREQGSFAVGGSVTKAPGPFDPLRPFLSWPELYGDHAYVFYQAPVNARRLPLVMWHGAGQSSKTWESTPDGREGYQNIFLRRGFTVYLVDQPRRGKAGRSTVPMTIKAIPDSQQWFNQSRLGVWPDFFQGVQFSREPAALEQYYRQITPDTGPFDVGVTSDAMATLFKKIGPGVLLTHSQAGGPGWVAAMKTPEIRAVIAYEPGSGFVFPQDEVPPAIASAGGALEAVGVPLAEFLKLTKIPVVLVYGDNIPEKPVEGAAQDSWRVRLAMARLWRDALNRRGGDVTIVHLPELGIRGNTHFPFSDLNNLEIADLLSAFLKSKQLDER